MSRRKGRLGNSETEPTFVQAAQGFRGSGIGFRVWGLGFRSIGFRSTVGKGHIHHWPLFVTEAVKMSHADSPENYYCLRTPPRKLIIVIPILPL